MERFVSLLRMTPKGKETFQKAGDYNAQLLETVQSFGGTLEAAYYVGGAFDFLTVTTYPDKVAALKARAHAEALGVVTIEGYPAWEIGEYLAAVTS